MSHIKATLKLAQQLVEQGVLKSATQNSRALFNLSKFYKTGLLSDDLMKDSEVTREALRRLPKDVYQERQYRLTRAIGYNTGKSVLPESQWTKPEEDVSYLKPFIDQVVAEIREKEDWASGKIQ